MSVYVRLAYFDKSSLIPVRSLIGKGTGIFLTVFVWKRLLIEIDVFCRIL